MVPLSYWEGVSILGAGFLNFFTIHTLPIVALKYVGKSCQNPAAGHEKVQLYKRFALSYKKKLNPIFKRL